jgi:hypothetical protein
VTFFQSGFSGWKFNQSDIFNMELSTNQVFLTSFPNGRGGPSRFFPGLKEGSFKKHCICVCLFAQIKDKK